MGLLELCLLPLLSPQEPPVNAAPEAPPVAVTTAPAKPDDGLGDLQDLLAAEKAGEKADVDVLKRLAAGQHATIAARAAWLLGRTKHDRTTAVCCEVVASSPHAEARVQAMNALLQFKATTTLPSVLAALKDSDRGVRTLAAQLAGKLRRPAAVEPLLAMIDSVCADATAETAEAATDVQAALLALHDLKAAKNLLRAATAIHDGKVKGTGQALAYCLQNLSPQLEKSDEVTTLLAVLDHRESLVRRYAIGRLAELRDPATASALEGRLATESAELRPLVELALAQVRSDNGTKSYDELERALVNLKQITARAEARWNTLTDQQRIVVVAVPVVLLALLWLRGRLRRRHDARAEAAATAALVAPSEEYLDQMSSEADALASEAGAIADAATADDGGEEFASATETHGSARR